MKQVKHCIYDHLHFLSPACPVLKNLKTKLCHFVTCAHAEKKDCGHEMDWAVLWYHHEYEWLLSQEHKGSIAFLERGLLSEGNNTLFFHLMVLIHYCTVYNIVISTVIWIRSCYIRNRKHPGCELKGWNDVTLQSMCRSQVSTQEVYVLTAMMDLWHWQ